MRLSDLPKVTHLVASWIWDTGLLHPRLVLFAVHTPGLTALTALQVHPEFNCPMSVHTYVPEARSHTRQRKEEWAPRSLSRRNIYEK